MGVVQWTDIQNQPHQIACTATVMDYNRKPVATPPLKVERVSFGYDAVARPCLSAQVTVPIVDTVNGVDWAPSNSDSPLTPFGNMMQVSVTISNSTSSDTVVLGLGVIQSVDVARPEGSITVTLGDHFDLLSNSVLEKYLPRKGDVGRDYAYWFRQLFALARVPGGPSLKGLAYLTDPPYLVQEHDTWTVGSTVLDALEWLTSVQNVWWWFDRDGDVDIRPGALRDPQLPTTAPAKYRISDGPGGSLLSLETSLSRNDVVNRVVAIGVDARTGATITGAANVTWGPLKVARIGNRNLVFEYPEDYFSKDQLTAIAQRKLNALSGVRRDASLSALMNPYLNPADSIEVKRGSTSERFTVRSVEWTLPDATMRVTAQSYLTNFDSRFGSAGVGGGSGVERDEYGLEQIVGAI